MPPTKYCQDGFVCFKSFLCVSKLITNGNKPILNKEKINFNNLNQIILIHRLKGIFQMTDKGPRKAPLNSGNRNQIDQNVQNGITINRISSTGKNKKRSPQATMSGIPNQEGALPVNNFGVLRKRKKKLTRKQAFSRIGVGILSVLILLGLLIGLIYNYIFSGLDVQEPSNLYPTEALTYQPPSDKDITNILLLGVDSRNPKVDKGLSDSIIILTIDRKNNVIKMTSIMRDCYVYIPGYKAPEKINAAHSLGGPELAMRTINNTLRLNIEKYMVVNFQSMADIIDIAGGVTLTITEAERVHLNGLLLFDFPKLASTITIKTAGKQKVNGKQAVMFGRIRKIDSDYERTRRQRDVLSALFIGFKDASAVNKAQMIQKGLSNVTTNMTPKEITSLGLDVMPRMSSEIQQLRLPLDGYFKVNSTGVWYMVVDYNRMIPEVYKFIYGAAQPFDPVPTIPLAKANSSNISKSISISGEDNEPIPTEEILESISSSSFSSSPSSSSSSKSEIDPTIDPLPTTNEIPSITIELTPTVGVISTVKK